MKKLFEDDKNVKNMIDKEYIALKKIDLRSAVFEYQKVEKYKAIQKKQLI